MIDFAGIAGKFTGRAASDSAPQGAAGQSLPGEDPATGGFAALINLAAESEAGPGFVADNAQTPGTTGAVPEAISTVSANVPAALFPSAQSSTVPTSSEGKPVLAAASDSGVGSGAKNPGPADVPTPAADAPASPELVEDREPAAPAEASGDDTIQSAPPGTGAFDAAIALMASASQPAPPAVETAAPAASPETTLDQALKAPALVMPSGPAPVGMPAAQAVGTPPASQIEALSGDRRPALRNAMAAAPALLVQTRSDTIADAPALPSIDGATAPATGQALETGAPQLLSREIIDATARVQPARPQRAVSANAGNTDPAAFPAVDDATVQSSPAHAADEPGRALNAAPSLSDAPLQTSAPLRSIVDGLPPMIQSELAAQPVRAVVGPVGGATTADALGEQVIDMGVSGQWIDRMAQEIAGLATGAGHSRFTLSPPHLGRVQVDLWQGQDATNVRLMAETDEAARRLAEGSQSLAADARLTALSLGTVTVEKASAPFDSGREQRQDQRQSGDLSGQAQQNGQNQAQARSGNGGNSNHGNGQGSEWVRRFAPDQPHEASETSPRASGSRSANGRVRFA